MGLNIEDVTTFGSIPTLHDCGKDGGPKRSESIEARVEEALTSNGGDENIVDPLRGLFQELRVDISKQLIGRDALVDCILAGLISGVPVAIFGPPGTAKSACVRMVAKACTSPSTPGDTDGAARVNYGRYFEWLVTNHTMPEELFGPPNIKDLEDGVFKRNISGKLPEAEFVFLDEVFRGGGHILNTLLTVINEGQFHDGTCPIDVPLIGLVAAANTPPANPDVDAFYDRFPVRVWVDSVLEEAAPLEVLPKAGDLLEKSANYEWQQETTRDDLDRKLCTNHFRAARKVMTIGGNNKPGRIKPVKDRPRFKEYAECYDTMRKRHGISDRSLYRLYRFGCALDWLQGRDMNAALASNESRGHYEVFKYVAGTEELARDASDQVDAMIRGSRHHGNA